MAGWRAVDLIARKRDGGALDSAELRWLVGEYLRGLDGEPSGVSEAQMAALLMAGVLRGFSRDEAVALTSVMVSSGEVLDLSPLDGPTVDKHSTGGVGDGTTLLVAPLLASAGAQLVKLSGRGLGHTGGTLDKLESIPGFRVDLEPAELLAIAGDVGCVVAAQTERLVPADKALYALRDVTGTVASTALIASSVMSKKLASGASTIVLDVKAGDGAFMPDAGAAGELAELCVGIGTEAGRACAALVTAMDQPLGTGIGNALEVAECVELLQEPPSGRLALLALELAAAALAMARGSSAEQRDAEHSELVERWQRGEALEKLRAMVAAQGGDAAVCDAPRKVLPRAPVVREVLAGRAGSLQALPARAVGEAAAVLGAGRARKGDVVDPAVGIELHVEVGQAVEADSPVATVFARTGEAAEAAGERLLAVLDVVDTPVDLPETLLRVVS